MWAQRVRREERDGLPPRVTVEPFPAACNRCDATTRERFGCARDERFAGRGSVVFTWAADFSDARLRRTCPRYYAETDPDIAAVMWELEDYTRGALGRVGALPAPLVTYLRLAEIERQRWRDTQMES